MKFMNVAETEFFDILSKLASSIVFSRNHSPLAVCAAQASCAASSSLPCSKALLSSAILCQSQKGHLCLDTELVTLECAVNVFCLPLWMRLVHATLIKGQGCT